MIRGLKQYGMILADNGGAIRLSTDADPRWGDPASEKSANYVFNGWTHCLRGHDFEVVNDTGLQVSGNSGAAGQ